MSQLGVVYYVGLFPKLSESFILNEISELHKRGHNVAVFAQRNPEEEITHQEYRDIDIPVYYSDPSYRDVLQLVSSHSIQKLTKYMPKGYMSCLSLKEIGSILLLSKQCADFIHSLDFEVDIIHSHFATATRVAALLAAKENNIPCTVTAHAFEIFKSPDYAKIRYICNNMSGIVVPSEYNRQYLDENIGVQNSIYVVPATTRINKFESATSPIENRILTVGRLIEKKGITFAIEAVNQLIKQGIDIEYHIIGSGPLKNRLQQQVSNSGIEDNVKFLGNVSDSSLKKELKEASIFLLPCVVAENGDRDAMPVVLKEAMASETTCVSTTVSAIPELITDGYDGVLVPPRDPDSLAVFIMDLLENPEERKRLAMNGKNTVRTEYSISISVDKLVDVFHSYTNE
ncbi:colanic acid biosynthesis glycosyltransferase WcaL [Haloplanus rallus]|uniref:Colanic acid biosynthesis glycosyltransferase WcaL n=1 Tax=Haloplanus rallus TaxID=1816183 RepID=A0A6B9FDW1_9EURY|nr:glycosyltransferase [Haloplanus rallus]QGX94810.1 colanic acid biosynthesis glycosyltransferase WcaL [Haloplanus rallus]